MKTFPILARIFLFLTVLCDVACGHPSYNYDAPKKEVKFGYRAFKDTSPVPRGLFSTEDLVAGDLSKRQSKCASSEDLFCGATGVCCQPGSSCCNVNFCCAAGAVCPLFGDCIAGDVVTVTFTVTDYITSSMLSTVFDTSTTWVYITSVDYTTITTQIEDGVSTSTVFVTVTTTQVMKRTPLAAPTPVMTKTYDLQADVATTTKESFLFEGQTPVAHLLRLAFANVGLLEKRAVTSYQTLSFTSVIYSYSYYTINDLVTATSNVAVESTITSTVVDGASSTVTVTSVMTDTVTSKAAAADTTPPAPANTTPPAPADNTPDAAKPTVITTIITTGDIVTTTLPGGQTSTINPGPETITSVGPGQATTSNPVASGKHSGLSSGAEAGIGIGAALGAAVVAALIFFLWRRRSKNNQTAASSDPAGYGDQPEFYSPVKELAAVGGAGAAAHHLSQSSTVGAVSPTSTYSNLRNTGQWQSPVEYQPPQQSASPPPIYDNGAAGGAAHGVQSGYHENMAEMQGYNTAQQGQYGSYGQHPYAYEMPNNQPIRPYEGT